MYELLRRLDREHFKPSLACFHAGGELRDPLTEIGVEPIEVPLHGSLARPNTAVQVARLVQICRRRRIRVLHAHSFYANLIAVAAAKLARARTIVSRRDLANWLSPAKQRTQGIACRLADRVLANADAVAQRYITVEGGEPEKLRVVPNGIDLEVFDRQAAQSVELPPRKPGFLRAVTVASMNYEDKGHADLLDTARLLHDRGVPVEWLLVSDGSLRPSLEARAQGLEVHFLGRQKNVAAVLAATDLLVHPSWAEGFPNALLEGMSASLPVVSTDVGGCPELVVHRQTGLLVPPRRPSVLASAIERLASNRAWASQLGAAGRARVAARFTLDRMTRTVENLYNELA
jgi:glycosyltransferase involved in cell wall biosynthesis